MARKIDKENAIALRKKGMSYSQIKQKIGVSKSTLSGWLSLMPLSEDRIRQLGPLNQKRIERCRNTKMKKRDNRLLEVFKKVSNDIGCLSNRDIFIAGLFLYWGEGGKTKKCTTVLTNTNPKMLRFFIKWLDLLGVDKGKLKIHLHLYSDMNVQKQIRYWSKYLNIREENFRKPYVKSSKSTNITYKNGFGQGTCSIVYDNRDVSEYVLQALKYIENI